MSSDLLMICYEDEISIQKLTELRCEELLERGLVLNDLTADSVPNDIPILIFFPFSFPPNPVFQFTPALVFIFRNRAPFVFQGFIRPGGRII